MAKLQHKFGLGKPIPMQYVSWITGIFRGDLGGPFTMTCRWGVSWPSVFPSLFIWDFWLSSRKGNRNLKARSTSTASRKEWRQK
jgi:hypothetical protein